MSTNILDLLDTIDRQLDEREHVAVVDAAAALLRAHDILMRLHAAGLDANKDHRREIAARGLAVMARTVGAMLPHEPGRVTQLCGALGDTIGRLQNELTRSDRWAITIRLGSAARKCVSVIEESGPYGQIPELAALKHSTSNLRRTGALNPPDPTRCAGLTRPIPRMPIELVVRPAAVVHEATAGIVDYLNLRGRERIYIRQAIGICSGAYRLTKTTLAIAPDESAPDASAAWRSAAKRLAQLEDGMHLGPDDRLLRLIVHLHKGLERLDPAALTPFDLELLRDAVGFLPTAAEALDTDLYGRSPAMVVPVGHRPLREGRVSEWLLKRAFMTNRNDLAHLHGVLATAGRVAPEPADLDLGGPAL